MRMKWVFFLIPVLLLISLSFEHASAQTPPKHIRIENVLDPPNIAQQYTQAGGWSVKHSNGTSFTCPTGSQKQYTISGSPTLDASDTSSPDHIMFHNTTITANNAGVCGRIYFWASLTPGPSGTIGLSLSSAGSLTRGGGSATNSWAHFSGWLQHPATTEGAADGTSGTWEHVGSLSGPPASAPGQDKHATLASWAFPPPNAVNETLTGISSARIIKGEIWFMLANQGDQLILTPGSGVKVTTAAGGGGDGDPDPNRPSIYDFMDSFEREHLLERLQRIEKKLQLPPFSPQQEIKE